jgi:hypothetical protein
LNRRKYRTRNRLTDGLTCNIRGFRTMVARIADVVVGMRYYLLIA